MIPERFWKFATWAVIILAVFLAVQSIAGIMTWNTIGSDKPVQATIVVSGHGEVFAAPDTATVSFGVTNEAATVADAQSAVTTKMNAILAAIKNAGIQDKDITTTNYNIYPRYDYITNVVVSGGASSMPCYNCGGGKQHLAGYDVSQNVDVKIRDISKSASIIGILGSMGATNVSGLSFTVGDQDALKLSARNQAITKAKDQANKLADSLGVRLIRITSFNENSYEPIRYGMASAMSMGATKMDANPQVPAGQSKITDDVTLTYEIR